ncbi:globin, protozoan/cyanobacterial family [Bacteriovorax sp. BAL6_X]|uniref:group II truncated hemoglobin n=1 Tax=Bacteriovorax sp. BAL6_X TaxID=1201290 RepID=UPI000386346A|nr:group II truncated hemoglobin [Bacteriovorax sp. BAL6_X]EPZ51135.1 globin, protozoan/cyanobacterial family [Bacteriovorax sp. BAL6_X]
MKIKLPELLIRKFKMTPYHKLGGAEGVQELVNNFYEIMDTDPKASKCRATHARSLESANKKLFMFLSGWLGGPSLYIEKYGHPRMRKRHFPFKIGFAERDEWLYCMRKAMDLKKLKPEFDKELWGAFERFAEHMRNQDF